MQPVAYTIIWARVRLGVMMAVPAGTVQAQTPEQGVVYLAAADKPRHNPRYKYAEFSRPYSEAKSTHPFSNAKY